MSAEDALSACLNEARHRLARGVADRRSAFHTPSLATVGPDGVPAIRTLVLRGFEPDARRLRLHTDARSGKVRDLMREPRCALHVYDASAGLQLRLGCVATLHAADEVAEAAWHGSRDSSRMCYAAEPGPGTPVPAPLPAPYDPVGGREHFAVLLLRFDRLEWLELAAAGHRRAGFAWAEDGTASASWLVP